MERDVDVPRRKSRTRTRTREPEIERIQYDESAQSIEISYPHCPEAGSQQVRTGLKNENCVKTQNAAIHADGMCSVDVPMASKDEIACADGEMSFHNYVLEHVGDAPASESQQSNELIIGAEGRTCREKCYIKNTDPCDIVPIPRDLYCEKKVALMGSDHREDANRPPATVSGEENGLSATQCSLRPGIDDAEHRVDDPSATHGSSPKTEDGSPCFSSGYDAALCFVTEQVSGSTPTWDESFAMYRPYTGTPAKGRGKPTHDTENTKRDLKGSKARKRARITASLPCHNSGDENQPPVAPGTTLGDGDHERRRLACPFYKKDPSEYQDCGRFDLYRRQDVKQHINRKHRKPDKYCPVCFTEFKEAKTRDDHIREARCTQQPEPKFKGISEQQAARLRDLNGRGRTDEQHWYDIWEIIFPGEAHPKSTYMGSPRQEGIALLRAFWEQKRSRVIADSLRSRNTAGIDADFMNDLMENILDHFEAECWNGSSASMEATGGEISRTSNPRLKEECDTFLEWDDVVTVPSLEVSAEMGYEAASGIGEMQLLDLQSLPNHWSFLFGTSQEESFNPELPYDTDLARSFGPQ
ncbi:hypothetical protein F4778DRAFT_784945 [Xylariomycetidae sp. FL2044]|nr:hypothetical protein F4778DRAFT_784945 [Xylariomycetidae sp. FL2044]